jgi:hypothetical protein
MRHKHVFYELAKNRLVARLTRILGAYRLGNISMANALKQSENEFRKISAEIQRYTTEIQAKRDLGPTLKPLSPQSLQKLENQIAVTQQAFKDVLKDSKT